MILVSLVLIACIFITHTQKTAVTIKQQNFYINGDITYKNAAYKKVQGLLLNSRLVQGIFDDYNTSTVHNWQYPYTKKWDPMRNTQEFIGNMTKWRQHNLLSFTLGLQGGNPREPDTQGYPADWIVSAFDFKTGELDKNYMNRLDMILKEADSLGMIVIVQFFYCRQVPRYNKNNNAIKQSIDNIIQWLMDSKYTNILIEVANEDNHKGFEGTILDSVNITETISYVQNISNHKYGVGTSWMGVPTNDVIGVSDIILLHGNNKSPSTITDMINQVRNSDAYKSNSKPILFTEDNNFNFNSTSNNFKSAIEGHASWGCMLTCNSNDGGDYQDAYQCPPTSWAIDTNRKAAFFEAVANYTKS
eukprot:333914_1